MASYGYRHPYTMEPQSARDVLLVPVRMDQAGEVAVRGLRVAGASHYISRGGIVSQNCGFDELTEFLESQYRFMQARLRTTATLPDGRTVPVRLRAATNPGGVGHDWVRERFRAWLGDKPTAASGEKRWYKRTAGDVEEEVERGTPGSLSRQFIRAKLSDNPTLAAQEGYTAQLDTLPLLVRMALRDGRWDLVAEGNVIRREWLSKREKRAPEGLHWVRYYDLAASLAETASRTATVAAAFDGSSGILYLRDGWAGRLEWPEQVDLIRKRMLAEPDTKHGIEAKLHGLAMLQELRRDPELAGVMFEGINVTKDKLQRAFVWSKRAEEGKVVFVEDDDGSWIEPWIEECVLFDGSGRTFDDRVDAISGCAQMIGVQVEPASFTGLPSPPAAGWGIRRGNYGTPLRGRR